MLNNTLQKVISELKSTPSVNIKLEVLKSNLHNRTVKEYLRLLCCPSVSFYITAKTVPEITATGNREIDSLEYLIEITDPLCSRKVRGNSSKIFIADVLTSLTKESQRLYIELITKTKGVGVGSVMLNSVWPNLCVSIPYQRCSLPDEKTLARFKNGEGFIVQTKSDGMFASLVLEPSQWNEDVKLFTRNGSKFPQHFAEYIAGGLNDMNAVYEGELLCFRNSEMLSRKEGNGILNSVMQGGELPKGVSVKYHVWNRLPHGDWKVGKTNKTYGECFKDVCKSWSENPATRLELVDYLYVETLEQAYAFNQKQLEAGLEGSIIKTLTHKWKDGTSKECVKLKLAVEIDLIWKDSAEGKGKAAGMLGAMCLESECGKLKVDVGTGFSDNQRRELWENKDNLHGSVVTISANDIVSREGSIDKMSLFLPVFTELREKTQADSLERIQQIFNAAKHIS